MIALSALLDLELDLVSVYLLRIVRIRRINAEN